MTQRPPWVLMVVLPDDCPPVAVDLSSLPEGSQVRAFCGELSEKIIFNTMYTAAEHEAKRIADLKDPGPENSSNA